MRAIFCKKKIGFTHLCGDAALKVGPVRKKFEWTALMCLSKSWKSPLETKKFRGAISQSSPYSSLPLRESFPFGEARWRRGDVVGSSLGGEGDGRKCKVRPCIPLYVEVDFLSLPTDSDCCAEIAVLLTPLPTPSFPPPFFKNGRGAPSRFDSSEASSSVVE